MTLDLFAPDPQTNVLPYRGSAGLWSVPHLEQAEFYFHYLLEHLPWRHDEAKLYGKHFITPRKVAWYGDAHYRYAYSGVMRDSLPWDEQLFLLKQSIEQLLGEQFNSCLANLYEEGTRNGVA
jgi:alkylated DNA repair dioxygenase AlkB